MFSSAAGASPAIGWISQYRDMFSEGSPVLRQRGAEEHSGANAERRGEMGDTRVVSDEACALRQQRGELIQRHGIGSKGSGGGKRRQNRIRKFRFGGTADYQQSRLFLKQKASRQINKALNGPALCPGTGTRVQRDQRILSIPALGGKPLPAFLPQICVKRDKGGRRIASRQAVQIQ